MNEVTDIPLIIPRKQSASDEIPLLLPPKKKSVNGTSSNGSTESLPQSEQEYQPLKSPTEIVSEFSGGGSLFPKGSENVDVSGEPPFAFPVNKEKIKTDVEESVKKIHADAGYSWERDANVIGRVEGNEPAPLSQEKLGGFFEGLRRGIEQHPMSDPLTKIAAESFVNSAQMTAQGLTDLSNATPPTEINNFWQTFELPAALVKTGFGAASMAVPSLQAFMAGFTAAEKILPSDVIGFMMAPVQTIREKGGIVAFPLANEVRIFDFGQTGDDKQAAAELTDLLFQILTFHGAKALANKVIHNELLTPIEAQEMNRLVDEGFRDATILEREALKRVPEDIPAVEKVKVVPLISEKQNLETQRQNLESQKSKVDENFHPKIDEEIKATEEKIDAANEKIKSITEQKKQDTRTEEPTIEENSKTKNVTWENLMQVGNTIKWNGEDWKLVEKKSPYMFVGENKSGDRKLIGEKPDQAEDSYILYQNGKTEPQTLPVEEKTKVVENKADSEVSGGKLADEGFRRNLVDEHFSDIVNHLKGKGLLKVEC